MKCFKKLILFSNFFVLLLMSSMSFANIAQMNTTLSRISVILNQVNPLINLAQKQQAKNTRVKFQFNTLRNDISYIQAGIAQALNRVSIQPRTVAPLSGDYLPVAETVLKREKPLTKEDER
jgi:RAQPRD family integrative conjugative element protein